VAPHVEPPGCDVVRVGLGQDCRVLVRFGPAQRLEIHVVRVLDPCEELAARERLLDHVRVRE